MNGGPDSRVSSRSDLSPSKHSDNEFLPMSETGDEFARIFRRIGDTYFGDDRPWTMSWPRKFVCALLGVVSFSAVVLHDTLRVIYEVTAAMARHMDGSNKSEELDVGLVQRLLQFADAGYEFLGLVCLPLGLAFGMIIASGIKHGGPLRLFFAGVAVPAAVMFIATNAIS